MERFGNSAHPILVLLIAVHNIIYLVSLAPCIISVITNSKSQHLSSNPRSRFLQHFSEALCHRHGRIISIVHLPVPLREQSMTLSSLFARWSPLGWFLGDFTAFSYSFHRSVFPYELCNRTCQLLKGESQKHYVDFFKVCQKYTFKSHQRPLEIVTTVSYNRRSIRWNVWMSSVMSTVYRQWVAINHDFHLLTHKGRNCLKRWNCSIAIIFCYYSKISVLIFFSLPE